MKDRKDKLFKCSAKDIEGLLTCKAKDLGEEIPKELLLIANDETITFNNRKPVLTHTFTKHDLDLVAKNFQRMQKDVVCDYEHQTQSGDKAPASGWLNDIYHDKERGLIGKIKYWTKAAQKHISEKEYRFFSPVISPNYLDSKLGRRVGPVLKSVSLTNDPLIYWQKPLMAKQSQGEQQVDEFRKAIIAKLKLAETATDDDILAALGQVVDINTQVGSIFQQLGVEKAEKSEDVVAAKQAVTDLLSAKQGQGDEDNQDFVAKSEHDSLKKDHDALKTEIGALKLVNINARATSLIDKALELGKIPAVNTAYYMKQAQDDPDAFELFIEKAPQIVPTGELLKMKAGDGGSLNVNESVKKGLEIVKAFNNPKS